MTFVPAGFQHPTTTTVERRPRSVRRTSDIAILFARADGPSNGGGLGLHGTARDLLTDPHGQARVLEEASVRADLDAQHQLLALETSPGEPGVRPLLGRRVGRGFRAAVDQAVPAHRDHSSPLYLLLDDLPVAALISGYANLYGRDLAGGGGAAGGRDLAGGDGAAGGRDLAGGDGAAGGRDSAGGDGAEQGDSRRRSLRSDICSGWRSDGTMMVALREKGQVPITTGPVAPPLEGPDDPWAWHDMTPLPASAMRRRRLIDVAAGAPLAVRAMFRDTYAGMDGVETVLHEYSLELDVDPGTLVVLRSEATPRVLPWVECPAAAASARRLEGQEVGALRRFVHDELTGTSTCTHLNDLLRCVADVGALTLAL